VLTDLNVHTEPSLPSLPAAGGTLTDPVFGTEILRVTDATTEPDTGAVDNSVIDALAAVIAGTQAKVRVKAGASGSMYKLTFVLTLSDGSVLEEDILMVVQDR
jgi:hypothetical protein